ncbi:MAG: hypothetical protein D6729_17430 [Deltaproteobacteria bacterium]|nr:MAG: hypothetical protein D6729_17430 [Deltaproteobacteria bacterium]
MTRRPGLPIDEFFAPLPLLAVGVLALNDHVLKGSGLLPGWVTGKLSDLAGLFFFPLFLSALVGLVTRRPATRRRLVLACLFTGLGFALLQLSAPVAAAYLWVHRALFPFLGPLDVTQDATDLVALSMLPLAYLYGRRRLQRRQRRAEAPSAP